MASCSTLYDDILDIIRMECCWELHHDLYVVMVVLKDESLYLVVVVKATIEVTTHKCKMLLCKGVMSSFASSIFLLGTSRGFLGGPNSARKFRRDKCIDFRIRMHVLDLRLFAISK